MLAPLRGDLVFEMVTSPSDGIQRMALVDLATGRRRALRWPSALADIDGVVAQPSGRLVAVGVASFARSPQAEDIFLLDTRNGRFTHVPGYPIFEGLKRSSVAWTSDDRLVLTIVRADTTTLGVYRPGDRQVSIRRIKLPPYAGSDTFVPITTRP
jgi:tricorn protease-like protein